MAGNDINDCVSFVEKQGINRNHDAPAFIDALREFTKPIIAAVDGFAVGIGVTLLLYCDLVFNKGSKIPCASHAPWFMPRSLRK